MTCEYEWQARPACRTGSKHSGCPACANLAIWWKNCIPTLFPEIASEFDIDKNVGLDIMNYATESPKRVWWLCNDCGYSWQTTFQKRTRDGNNCPACSGRVAFGDNNLLYIFPDVASEFDYEKNYPKTPLDFTSKSGQKIWWICKENHNWKATVAHRTVDNTGCPICNESYCERFISWFLKINNIEFVPQYKFDDCRNIQLLPFDFYLPEYNTCIEGQGEQHFRPIEFFGGEDQFQKQLFLDKIKSDYCRDNNIPLIIIPYTDFNKIEEILTHELGL